MGDSTVDPNVANTVKEFSLLAIPAPGPEQFADTIALFPFPGSATRVEQELLDQSAMRRKLFRTKRSKCQVAHKIGRSRILRELSHRLFRQLLPEIRRLLRILQFPVAEGGESVDEVQLRSSQFQFEVAVDGRCAPAQFL